VRKEQTMSRYVKADMVGCPCGYCEGYEECQEEVDSAPSIDIVFCKECKRVREDGGHANCGGYLYCRKWKTLVDEDCYCSWGEREGE
jgi:hypothetical protein